MCSKYLEGFLAQSRSSRISAEADYPVGVIHVDGLSYLFGWISYNISSYNENLAISHKYYSPSSPPLHGINLRCGHTDILAIDCMCQALLYL